ncbi:hypothetical protein DL96DRAFT_1170193 [Flagelloscypha sp. PMI_526]|nr:hypothetical protein DL96DRAFT_1170193 [Flagelloscypha sp. PMI_526]
MAPTSTATSANFVPRTTRSVAYPHLDARKLRALHALHRRQTLTPTGPLYAHRIPNPLLPSAPIVTPNTRLPVQLAIILGGAGFVALILAASLGYLFYRRRASALARQISTDLDHISWPKAFLTQNSRNISTKEKEPSLTVCQIPSCPSSLSRLSHEKHRESHCGSVDGPFHEIQLDAPLPLFDQRSMPVFETSSIVFTRSSSSSSSSTLPSESSHQSSLMTLGNTEPNLNVFFVANGTQGVDYADEEVFEVRRAETQSLEVMKAVLLTSVDSKHAKEKNKPVPRLAISAPSEPLPLPLPTAPSAFERSPLDPVYSVPLSDRAKYHELLNFSIDL